MSNQESFDLNRLLRQGAKVTRQCFYVVSMVPSSMFTQFEGPFYTQEEADDIVYKRRELGSGYSGCWRQYGIYQVELNGFAYQFDTETRQMIKQTKY